MKQIKGTKPHLLVKRFKIMKFLESEGYNNEEIGDIVNMNRVQVFRALKAGEKYKKSVKNLLKD